MGSKSNTGIENSGDLNSGNLNSGHRNSGDLNSGNLNSGHRNSGDLNSGDWNSGDWNSGNLNSGYFNTNTPDKVRIFNTWIEMTHEEFNENYNIYAELPLNLWTDIKDCTEEEKKIKGITEMGGYLKTLPFKEACQIWWKENPNRHKDFLTLPSFNTAIFKEITGIDVEVTNSVEQEAIEVLKKAGYKITRTNE